MSLKSFVQCIVTHTGPHRVTSSNIYQIKAQSHGSSKLHDVTVRTEGAFYGRSAEGTPNTKSKAHTDKNVIYCSIFMIMDSLKQQLTEMIILINKTSVPCKRFLSTVTKKVNKCKSHEKI